MDGSEGRWGVLGGWRLGGMEAGGGETGEVGVGGCEEGGGRGWLAVGGWGWT